MFPKPPVIKSESITRSAHGELCAFRIENVCNHRQASTVFCHAPSSLKGMGTKSPDFWGAYGCDDCHKHADSGKVSYQDWMRAIFETQIKLIEKGLIQIKK